MRQNMLMLLRAAVPFLLLVLGSVSAFGQTSADIEKKFRATVKAYEIERGVLMVPRYDKSGQICEAVLENSHRTESGFYFGSALTDWMIADIVDKLMPSSERGKKSKSYGMGTLLGQSMQIDYSYENLQVVRVGGIKDSANTAVLIRWKKRPCS